MVDGNAAAIRAAREHAVRSGRTEVSAVAATCEQFLSQQLTPEQAARVTHVLVNPPRQGLSPLVLKRLSRAHLPQLQAVHYVSCSPQSLARDLREMATHGLSVEAVQPFDMFPQTEHVEVVVRLRA